MPQLIWEYGQKRLQGQNYMLEWRGILKIFYLRFHLQIIPHLSFHTLILLMSPHLLWSLFPFCLWNSLVSKFLTLLNPYLTTRSLFNLALESFLIQPWSSWQLPCSLVYLGNHIHFLPQIWNHLNASSRKQYFKTSLHVRCAHY